MWPESKNKKSNKIKKYLSSHRLKTVNSVFNLEQKIKVKISKRKQEHNKKNILIIIFFHNITFNYNFVSYLLIDDKILTSVSDGKFLAILNNESCPIAFNIYQSRFKILPKPE